MENAAEDTNDDVDMPSYSDILFATNNLKGIAHNTKIITSETINQ